MAGIFSTLINFALSSFFVTQTWFLRFIEEIYKILDLDQLNSVIDLTRECALKENQRTSRCNNVFMELISAIEVTYFLCFLFFLFLLFRHMVNYLFKIYAKQTFGAHYIEENDQKKKIKNKDIKGE